LKAGADPNLVVRSESMRRVSTRYMDNQLDVLFRKPGEACLESTGHALLRAGRPIHFAAMFGHIELVELLYKWGAEVTCEAGQCIQPVDLARAQGHQAVADFLLEAAGDEFFAV
ncbi:Ankrd28, partial [Symbiodinium sp. CCMP2456]